MVELHTTTAKISSTLNGEETSDDEEIMEKPEGNDDDDDNSSVGSGSSSDGSSGNSSDEDGDDYSDDDYLFESFDEREHEAMKAVFRQSKFYRALKMVWQAEGLVLTTTMRAFSEKFTMSVVEKSQDLRKVEIQDYESNSKILKNLSGILDAIGANENIEEVTLSLTPSLLEMDSFWKIFQRPLEKLTLDGVKEENVERICSQITETSTALKVIEIDVGEKFDLFKYVIPEFWKVIQEKKEGLVLYLHLDAVTTNEEGEEDDDDDDDDHLMLEFIPSATDGPSVVANLKKTVDWNNDDQVKEFLTNCSVPLKFNPLGSKKEALEKIGVWDMLAVQHSNKIGANPSVLETLEYN